MRGAWGPVAWRRGPFVADPSSLPFVAGPSSRVGRRGSSVAGSLPPLARAAGGAGGGCWRGPLQQIAAIHILGYGARLSDVGAAAPAPSSLSDRLDLNFSKARAARDQITSNGERIFTTDAEIEQIPLLFQTSVLFIARFPGQSRAKTAPSGRARRPRGTARRPRPPGRTGPARRNRIV